MPDQGAIEAQPDLNSEGTTVRSKETKAATDAVFKQEPPASPLDPQLTSESSPAPLSEEDELPIREDMPDPHAVGKDYVRELQLEFEEQEEEGKI